MKTKETTISEKFDKDGNLIEKITTIKETEEEYQYPLGTWTYPSPLYPYWTYVGDDPNWNDYVATCGTSGDTFTTSDNDMADMNYE